jgi:hypothetical protein
MYAFMTHSYRRNVDFQTFSRRKTTVCLQHTSSSCVFLFCFILFCLPYVYSVVIYFRNCKFLSLLNKHEQMESVLNWEKQTVYITNKLNQKVHSISFFFLLIITTYLYIFCLRTSGEKKDYIIAENCKSANILKNRLNRE